MGPFEEKINAPSRTAQVRRGIEGTVAREKAAIDSELTSLEVSLDVLSHQLMILEEKITPILGQALLTEQEATDRDYIGSSHVYGRVYATVSSSRSLADAVNRLANRVEV